MAGNGTAGYSGDGAAATSAELSYPDGVALDGSGNLAIADAGNNVVREVAATSGNHFGIAMTAADIYTVAGNGAAGYTGDDGPAKAAELNQPANLAFDGSGNLLIADRIIGVIREVHAAALPATALVVTAPSTAVVGTPVNVSVTATDATGATASGYMGTVHFTSVGGTPAMPADYTFTSADKGTHTFTVTFNTPSNQTLIVTDTSNPTLTGTATVAVRTPAPTVSSISPTSGSPGGGTSVTITGTNLWDLSTSAAVDFGTKPATVATCSTATSCTAISPAGSGTVDVTVNTRVGTSAPPPPTASLISAPP